MKLLPAAAGIVLLLSGCADSPNSTACALFADTYNDLALAISTGATPETVRASSDGLASGFQDALDRAEGDVAVAIRTTRDLSVGLADANADTQTTFFLSVSQVEDACAASGSPVTLAELNG